MFKYFLTNSLLIFVPRVKILPYNKSYEFLIFICFLTLTVWVLSQPGCCLRVKTGHFQISSILSEELI